MMLKVIQFFIVCLLALQYKASAYQKIELPKPLEPGMAIEVTGQFDPYNELGIFYINLQEEFPNVPLHVSVRFKKRKLLLTNWNNGEWGLDEVHHEIPEGLLPKVTWENEQWGQDRVRYEDREKKRDFGYNIRITARNDHFTINLNGRDYDFKYRTPAKNLGKIKYLVIAGNFVRTSVNWPN